MPTGFPALSSMKFNSGSRMIAGFPVGTPMDTAYCYGANPATLRQVAADTGARLGPPVFSDALSAPNGPAPSYLAMMRHNTSAFVAAVA